MRKGLKELGFKIGDSVTPLYRSSLATMKRRLFSGKRCLITACREPVISPAVSAGRQRLRTSYMATPYPRRRSNRVLETFHRVGKEQGII